jgi:uncharacterized integral membrane protein (TIGR00698 family)
MNFPAQFVPRSAAAWLALATVTLTSVLVAPYFPGWGNGMLCLLLGMALGNLWSSPWIKSENAAVLRWNEKNMLAWATILLGFEMQTRLLSGIPLSLVPALFLSVLGAVFFGEWLARRYAWPIQDTQNPSTSKAHSTASQARLLAAGNAICGNSAVAAVHPLLGASPAQVAVTITLINALGLFGTLFLGPLASLLGFGPTEKAVLMGSLLQSVGHVSAATSGLGEGPALLAMSLKMGRILLLIPLLLWFQSLPAEGNKAYPASATSLSNLRNLLGQIPSYVWGFVLCALATNLISWPVQFLETIRNLTQWMLWVALSAIGLNIRITQVLQQGWRALAPALGMFAIQILLVSGWLGLLKFPV